MYLICRFRLFNATDSEFVSQFSCPQFLGCIVTSSGIKLKDEIKDIVTKGGVSTYYDYDIIRYFPRTCLVVIFILM